MEYRGIFRPQAVTLATLTLLSLSSPLSSSAQITATGDTDPGSADPFWSTGGNTSTDATVGVTGVGSVTVENGSVLSLDLATLGRDAGSDGTITVTGDNGSGTASRLNTPNSLTIGKNGKGTLNIENGGLVTPDEVFIGTETGSVGLVTVTGVGSSLLSNDDLGVGGFGTGTLQVEAGGTVSVDLAFIGGGASGTVNVTGTGSNLNVSNGGILGFSNVGELNISNGGVTNFGGDLRLGQSATGDGRLIVDGTDSTYLGSGTQVTVGEEGAGTMTVRNGGELAVDSIFVGNVAGSSGTLNVDGTGSVVTTAQGVTVASSGNAVVNVTNGGLMAFSGPEPGFGIAENTGSTGSVTIDGAGSEIRSGAFQIGESGQATVTVSNGGKLSAGGGLGPGEIVLATEVGGSGTLNVGNGGAAGIINAPKVSGRAGTSTLNFNHNEADYFLTNDGTSSGTGVVIEGDIDMNHLNTGKTTLVVNNTFSGDITVGNGTLVFSDGSNTTTTGNDDNLIIGSVALQTGSVIINDGATVNIGNDLDVGAIAGSTGDLQVTGAGTQLNIGTSGGTSPGFADVGDNGGAGTLTVSDGAEVMVNRSMDIADNGGQGMVTVTGTNSKLTVNNNLTIDGEITPGQLSVLDGGFVQVDSIDLGDGDDESNGNILVSGVDSLGTASRLETTNGAALGETGGGNITVAAGGQFISSGDIKISNDRGLSSSITVTGAGSQFTSEGTTALGRAGEGILTVADGGVYSVDSGSGTIEIGLNSGNGNGTLNVGDGGGAGIVSVATVTTNTTVGNTGTINFNHNETDYKFTNDGTSGGTAISIEGQTSVRHIGTGTTTIGGNNTYTEGTTIEDGTLKLGSSTAAGTGTILIDGGTLDINGQTVGNDVSFGASGGVLKGSGTINASVALTSTNDVLAPGDSPGTTLYGANQTWESFTYLWELNNWEDQVAGTNFDQLQIDGSLSLTGSAIDNYNLDITSLTAADELGDLPNFSEIDQSWIIITTTGGITGFNADYWSILTSAFNTDPNAFGFFSLDVVGNDLVLTYTVPEPTTGALLLAGLGYMAIRRRR